MPDQLTEPERNRAALAAEKDAVSKITNLHHLSNWQRKHESLIAERLPHPADQAELWRHYGAHYHRLETRNRPPHPADAGFQQSSGRPAGMPLDGFAMRFIIHCGEAGKDAANELYVQICLVVAAAGGDVILAEKI